MEDKVKSNSGPSLFKLVAIDVFEVPETTHNISANPKNRVSLAQQRGEKFWAFVLNIMVPGPPHYCFVMYYTGDKVFYYMSEHDNLWMNVDIAIRVINLFTWLLDAIGTRYAIW